MMTSSNDTRPIRVARVTALVCYVLFLAFLALFTLHPAGGAWLASGSEAEMTATVSNGGDPAQAALRAKGIVGLE